jgi:chemotaxis protein CheZ
MAQKKLFSAEKSMLNHSQSVPETVENQVPIARSEEQHQEILDAIVSLKAAGGTSVSTQNIDSELLKEIRQEMADSVKLRDELQELSRVINDTRREISSLQSSKGGAKIHAMTDQLDAVVGDTETATNSILEAVEIIETKNESLEVNATDPSELEIVEGINQAIMKIYEACNFQDITGQRITKVVNTLKFVETRIEVMVGILGGDEQFEEALGVEEEVRTDIDGVELSGPQAEGQEISQDEIDALFD